MVYLQVRFDVWSHFLLKCLSRNNTNGKQPLLTSVTSCQTRQRMRIDCKAGIVTSGWRPWIKNVSCLSSLFTIPAIRGLSTHNLGGGTLYRLGATQSVAIESPWNNHNTLPFLLVSKHPQYPNKRSLVQFENLPSACPSTKVKAAKMYLYFRYAHKASWHSVAQTPYIQWPELGPGIPGFGWQRCWGEPAVRHRHDLHRAASGLGRVWRHWRSEELGERSGEQRAAGAGYQRVRGWERHPLLQQGL